MPWSLKYVIDVLQKCFSFVMYCIEVDCMLLILLYVHIVMLFIFYSLCLKNKLMRPGVESCVLYEKGVPGLFGQQTSSAARMESLALLPDISIQ